MLSKTIAAFLISSCLACGQQSTAPENRLATTPERVDAVADLVIPNDRRKVEVCGLALSMPASLKERKLQPIDSCIGDYQDRDMRIAIDVVPVGIEEKVFTRGKEYSNYREFSVKGSTVDGLKAEIVNCRTDEAAKLQYVTVLDIPEPGLTVWIHSKNPDKQKVANQIVGSVRFDHPVKVNH